MAKRAGCGNEGADKRHCADTCAGAGCGAAVNLPDTAMIAACPPGMASAWSLLELACGCMLCGGCAAEHLLGAVPDVPACPMCSEQHGHATLHRLVRAKGRARGGRPLEAVRVEIGAARGADDSLTVAFKHTPMDAGDAVVFRVGSFRGEDTDAPRRSDPARADPFGNAAAEQAVVQLARFLYAFVMKQEARWSVRAARALRATGADVLGHGTAAGVYNRAVTDPTLSHLFMRAICGQFDDIEAREVLTPSEFASSGTSRQKAGIITPQAMVEMAFKLLEPNKGGGVQRDTFDMLWANGADSTAVVEYLAFASLSVAKNAKPAKFKAAVNTAYEQEARAIDSRVSRDTVIAMYEDNINFANISAGLSRLEPTGKHYVFSSIFLPRLTRGDRDKLLKFSEVGKSLAEIKAGHTAHALGHVPEDQGVIDNLQLRRVHAYLSAAIEARQAAAAGGGPAAVAAVPPTGTTIPGRSPARDLEDTPFVRAYQPNTKEQTAATMHEDMYTGPLWEADFNTNDTVLSTMYFLKEQVLNACETSPGSRVPDKTSFVWRAGVWMMVDGKPAAVMQEAIRAKPAYWEPIRVGSGGLHWEKDLWKTAHRLARFTYLTEILAGYRETEGKLNWFFLDAGKDKTKTKGKGGGDHRQVSREKTEIASAWWLHVMDSLCADPAWAGKTFSTADVIQRSHERAQHCNVAYMIHLDMRLTEAIYAIGESAKNGGNHDLFLTAQRVGMFALVIANAHTYIKLGVYDRLLWLMESAFVREVYTTLAWLRKTTSGQTMHADYWVEWQVYLVRLHFGKKASRGLSEGLLEFVHRISEAATMRGSAKNNTAPADPGAVHLGVAVTTRLHQQAYDNFAKHQVMGPPGVITGPYLVKVVGKPSADLVEVPCDAGACLSGEILHPDATECLLAASDRLDALYSHQVHGGKKPGTGWCATVPTTSGSVPLYEYAQTVRDTSNDGTYMSSKSLKCPATGKPMFDKARLTAYLLHIRETGKHKMMGEPGPAVPLNSKTAGLLARIPKSDGSKPFALSLGDLAGLLADLRTASDISCRLKGPPKASGSVAEYHTQRPSAEALGHYVFKNARAAALAADPTEHHDGKPQQRWPAAPLGTAQAAVAVAAAAEADDYGAMANFHDMLPSD